MMGWGEPFGGVRIPPSSEWVFTRDADAGTVRVMDATDDKIVQTTLGPMRIVQEEEDGQLYGHFVNTTMRDDGPAPRILDQTLTDHSEERHRLEQEQKERDLEALRLGAIHLLGETSVDWFTLIELGTQGIQAQNALRHRHQAHELELAERRLEQHRARLRSVEEAIHPLHSVVDADDGPMNRPDLPAGRSRD